jgi:hypothetical protein
MHYSTTQITVSFDKVAKPLTCKSCNSQTEHSQIPDNGWCVCWSWKLCWRTMQRPPYLVLPIITVIKVNIRQRRDRSSGSTTVAGSSQTRVKLDHLNTTQWSRKQTGISSSNDSVTDECRVGHDLEGSSLTVALIRNLSGHTQKNHEPHPLQSGQPVSRTVE